MPYYNEDTHESPLMNHISFISILMLFSYLLTILPCDFFSRSFAKKLGLIYIYTHTHTHTHTYIFFFLYLPQAQPILLSISIFLETNSCF